MATICVFGDSIAWGAWDKEKGGWVERLRLHLWTLNKDFDVYNLGVSGDTTQDILERFNAEAAARKPDIVIFAMGVNDDIVKKLDNSHLVEIKQFEDNIKALIQKSRNFTNNVTFLGLQKVDEGKTTPIPWRTDYFYYNAEIQKYDKKLQEVVKKENVSYLSLFDLLSNENLEDGLHPDAKGHQKIFEKVKDFLVENKFI